jgi:hypothetical protein
MPHCHPLPRRKRLLPMEADPGGPGRKSIELVRDDRIQAAKRIDYGWGDAWTVQAWIDRVDAEPLDLGRDINVFVERAHLHIGLDLRAIDPDLKANEIGMLPEWDVERAIVGGRLVQPR